MTEPKFFELWINPSKNKLNTKNLVHLSFIEENNGYLFVRSNNFLGFTLMLEPAQHKNFWDLMESVMIPLQAYWDVYEKAINSPSSRHLTIDEQRIMHGSLRKSARTITKKDQNS